MRGIQFIIDERNIKTDAVIDLRTHKDLWEDIQDVLISAARRREKCIPLAKVKATLIASGKIRG